MLYTVYIYIYTVIIQLHAQWISPGFAMDAMDSITGRFPAAFDDAPARRFTARARVAA